MTLLNSQGDKLARDVQRRLVRAGMNDVTALAVDPLRGRHLVLRHGPSLYRVDVTPYRGTPPDQTARAQLPLLVAESLDGSEVAALADRGVSFLDEQGNAHLVLDGRTVLFTRATGVAPARPGRRPSPARNERRGAPALSLGRTSHRVVFALLADPSLAGARLRVLAAVAGASVGTVHSTLGQLERAGHLQKGGLRRGGALLDAWVDAYCRLALPSLSPRPLYATEAEWVDRLASDPGADALAGGAAAAAVLTGRLRATDGIAYVREVGPVVKLLRLAPTPTPYRVELRGRFWGDLPSPRVGFVPAVLLYGDLLRDGDDRAVETTRYLRESNESLRALDRI